MVVVVVVDNGGDSGNNRFRFVSRKKNFE